MKLQRGLVKLTTFMTGRKCLPRVELRKQHRGKIPVNMRESRFSTFQGDGVNHLIRVKPVTSTGEK